MTKTTSFEISRKLWEKGLKVETEKVWHDVATNGIFVLRRIKLRISEIEEQNKTAQKVYPAPDTVELWEVLPEKIDISNLRIDKYETGIYVAYDKLNIFLTDSLPEALGLMALWLIENGYIKNGGKEKDDFI